MEEIIKAGNEIMEECQKWQKGQSYALINNSIKKELEFSDKEFQRKITEKLCVKCKLHKTQCLWRRNLDNKGCLI
jgi:hypothetical protein